MKLKHFAGAFLLVGLIVSSIFGLNGTVGEAHATDITDIFTSSGTWVAPIGVTSVEVECWGGGGGGANSGMDGAGGGGAYSKKSSISVTSGNTYTVTVGVGGSSGSPGSGGGDSWFNSNGTVLAKGGNAGGGSAGSGGAAASGVGDIKFSGGNGGERLGSDGGGGGGSAGDAADGGNGGVLTGGIGGSVGGGNGGNGSTSGVGSAGSAPGGGGASGTGGGAGGNGARGECHIIYTVVPLAVSNGGTSTDSFTLNGVLYGNGTSTILTTSAGSANQVLRIPSGGGAPEFGAIDLSQSSAVSGILAIGNGGTGTTSTEGLKNTLGAASSGANSDITSLSGLTTPLSQAQGGTGATSTFTAGSVVFAQVGGMFGQNNGMFFWDQSNSRLGIGTASPGNRLEVNGTSAATHFKGTGSTPSIIAGSCAGVGGSASVSGTDTAGQITLTTGTITPANANCVTVTFTNVYGSAPHVQFAPANAATAALSGAKSVYVTSTASAFSFTVGATSLSNTTAYKWEYLVIE